MNPLVEQMLNATVSNDVETRLLEDLFEQNVECEAKQHKAACSHEVTHRYRYCKGGVNVCNSRAMELSREIMESLGMYCAHCKKPATKCWTIRPI